MNPSFEPATSAPEVIDVVSACTGSERLVAALASRGFDVVSAEGIRGIVDVLDDDRVCVALIDDTSAGWLREVTDLLQVRPSVLLLALVDIDTPAEMLAGVGAGVVGFVSPVADGDAIARTIRALIRDGVAIPRGLVPALVEEVRRGRGRSVTTAVGEIDVTEREWEILQLLLQRRSTREISEMLFVSVGTVRSHISALGRKLGAADREDTIRLLEGSRG